MPIHHDKSARTAIKRRLTTRLQIASLVIGVTSGVLGLMPKFAEVFGSFDHSGEVLLAICVVGFVVFAINMMRARSWAERNERPMIVIALILALASPVVGTCLWYRFLRVSSADEAAVDDYILEGDADLSNNPRFARDDYIAAIALAPRRASLRAKKSVAESYLKMR